MRNYRTILCVLLALAVALSLCACAETAGVDSASDSAAPIGTGGAEASSPPGTSPAEPSAAATAPPDPREARPDLVFLNWEEYLNRPRKIQPGTVFTCGISGGIPEYSPLPWNILPAGWLLGSVFEGLLYMYMNDPEDIRGCIAESWEHSGDYLTWTFRIRDGVTFTSGARCDAAAVAKFWDYLSGAQPHYFTNNNIGSWESYDTGEFVVHLSAPCAWFETAMCGGGFSIVDPAALALYGTEDKRSAVGTGPYYIETGKYDPTDSIVLIANTAYYLEERMPCIETGVFKMIGYGEETLKALLYGEIEGAVIDSPESDYFINSHYVDGYQYLLEEGYGGNIAVSRGASNPMWLNAKKTEVFRIFEAREAVCRFIDFSSVNERLYSGMGSVQDSLWAEGSSGYVPAGQFYYDPEEGQQLLASAGLEPSDISFSVIYTGYPDMYAAVQSELTKAGVQMEIKPLDPKYSFLPAFQGDWSIYFFGSMGYSNVSPHSPWKYILKRDAQRKLCWQDIYDPELYQMMLDEYDAMMTSLTWGGMISHCRRLTEYVQDDFGAIGAVQAPVFIALGREFKNGVFFSENHHIQLYYLYK